MNTTVTITRCSTIDEVRSNIDRIDEVMVALLAERGAYVRQAASFKSSVADVRAPARVEQVIIKVVGLANRLGADPEVTEQVYRAMISAFIEAELSEHSALQDKAAQA